MYLNKLYFTKKPHINTEIYILKIIYIKNKNWRHFEEKKI